MKGIEELQEILLDFYEDVAFLDNLDWDIINSRWFYKQAERKRIKHAEVLVPDILPLSSIKGIAVNNKSMVQDVNNLITRCGLAGRITFATFKPGLFF